MLHVRKDKTKFLLAAPPASFLCFLCVFFLPRGCHLRQKEEMRRMAEMHKNE